MTQPKHYYEDHVSIFGHDYEVKGVLASLITALKSWHQRSRQRIQLADLSDEMLEDIGISRAEAKRESAKPFWQS